MNISISGVGGPDATGVQEMEGAVRRLQSMGYPRPPPPSRGLRVQTPADSVAALLHPETNPQISPGSQSEDHDLVLLSSEESQSS